MLRNDLKQSLPENWRDLFKHRYCDPEDYEVAVFPSKEQSELPKTLVLNPNTLDIMDYFFDDKPDDYWINISKQLSYYHKNKDISKISHVINKKFDIKNHRNIITNIKNPTKTIRDHYPMINFTVENSKVIGITRHKLIACIFIPNPFPDKFNIVNHKNNDIYDYSIENLEWCDISYNNLSKNRKIKNLDKERFKYERRDLNGNILETFNSIDDLKNSYGKKVNKIFRIVNTDKLFEGNSIWKKIDTLVEKYISKYPINENEWFTNNFITSDKVEVNTCGIFRINGELRIGGFTSGGDYYIITIGGKRYISHRLIAETILNRKLLKFEVVDHIKRVEKFDIDNRWVNLRVVTQKENMMNEETRKLLKTIKSKSCEEYDLFGNLIKRHESTHKLNSSSISSAVNKKYLSSNNRLWCLPGDREHLNLLLKHIYYKYDEKGNLIEASTTFTKKFIESEELPLYRKKYLNTGMKTPNGFYFQQGDWENFLCDPTNSSFKKFREEIYWKDSKR